LHHRAVAQVKMPIVGAGDRDLCHAEGLHVWADRF
jgi:hypothetical protein